MILAGTGHRPNKLNVGKNSGYHEKSETALLYFARSQLVKYKPDIVLSGMAIGWDQALALASVSIGIPFKAYVPFKNQEIKWNKSTQAIYWNLLDEAMEVIYVTDGEYSNEAFQLRNIALVDNCTTLLALWNGTAGGTRNCVRYALKQPCSFINCWDEWLTFKQELKGAENNV